MSKLAVAYAVFISIVCAVLATPTITMTHEWAHCWFNEVLDEVPCVITVNNAVTFQPDEGGALARAYGRESNVFEHATVYAIGYIPLLLYAAYVTECWLGVIDGKKVRK